ncbi:LicD family protein [Clostridium perfringens]|nr:LicD family protein [Clostridium perfringens]
MKKELKKIQLELLLELDRVCKENNIKYSLAYGTALGAVRHKGFIPWDDDIDVLMLRADYNKFCDICKENLKEEYFIQNYKTDPNYPLSFAKLRNSNTTLVEKNNKNLDINHGVFIDIFIYDYVPLNKLNEYKQLFYIKLLCVLLQKNRYEKNIKGIIGKTINSFFPGRLHKIICELLEKNISKYNYNESRAISDLATNIKIPKEVFNKFKLIKFENYKFFIVEDEKSYLSKNYGDYMKLPEEKDRIEHHEYVKFDANKSYLNYKGIYYCKGDE